MWSHYSPFAEKYHADTMQTNNMSEKSWGTGLSSQRAITIISDRMTSLS